MPVQKLKPETEMEVTVTVRDLHEFEFMAALEKLDRASGVFTGKKAWSFADFKEACDKHLKRAQDVHQKIVDRLAERESILVPDEHGNMVPAKDEFGLARTRPVLLRRPDGSIAGYKWTDEAAYATEMAELFKVNFTVKLIPLQTDELLKANLSPKEMRLLRRLTADAPAPVEEPETVSS